MKDGSNTKEGHIYHELPNSGLPAQRLGMEQRAKFLLSKLGDVKGKTVLDIGGNVGGMSYYFAQAGAKVICVDYDENALQIGREFFAKQTLEGSVEFVFANVTPLWIQDLSKYDIVLWLSQWQWFVKQNNKLEGFNALFEISTKAKTFVFESAANDGRANIENATQDTLYQWLIQNTAYTQIDRYKSTDENWHKRDYFICTKSEFLWRRHRETVIKRVNRRYVQKINESGKLEATEIRDIKFLQEMQDSPLTPKVQNIQHDSYFIEYAGVPITQLTDSDIAFVLAELKKYNVVHRDITPSNLCFNGKNVMLIDFGWAIHAGETLDAPEALGEEFKDPNGYNDEYSLKKIQKHLLQISNKSV